MKASALTFVANSTDGMVLTPRASVASQHALGTVTPSASLAFQAAGTPFTIFPRRSPLTPSSSSPVEVLHQGTLLCN
jgi:hypothetical protein